MDKHLSDLAVMQREAQRLDLLANGLMLAANDSNNPALGAPRGAVVDAALHLRCAATKLRFYCEEAHKIINSGKEFKPNGG